MATPRCTQCASGMADGTRMSRMKLVEWPTIETLEVKPCVAKRADPLVSQVLILDADRGQSSLECRGGLQSCRRDTCSPADDRYQQTSSVGTR